MRGCRYTILCYDLLNQARTRGTESDGGREGEKKRGREMEKGKWGDQGTD